MDELSCAERKELSFHTLDQIGLGFSQGLFQSAVALPFRFFPTRLGPMIEFAQLVEGGVLPAQLRQLIDAGSLPGIRFLFQNQAPAEDLPGFGHLRLGDAYDDQQDMRWTAFSVKANRAAQTLFPPSLAGQLVAAIRELHSNIYEHSRRSRTGVVAFAAHASSFEAIVADSGIGVFESLRSNPAHASLKSHAQALQLAIQPGVSRHAGEPLRGHGFDRMLTGLLNRQCTLRFRSGTGAIEVDGRSSGNPLPIITDRACIPGFLISIECHV